MTKKNKQKRRKKKQQRFESLRKKLAQGPYREGTIIIEPEGYEKMSEVLEEFVEPYLDFFDTEEGYRKLLTLAVMAWNTSFLTEKQQHDIIDKVLNEGIPTGTAELKTGLKEIVNMLIVRKKAFFSQYTRRIIDFELNDIGSQYHLSVVSTLEKKVQESAK